MYLLDTSALLAHFLSEPGADEVARLIEEGHAWVAAVSWLELRIRLQDLPGGAEVLTIYQEEMAGSVDITSQVAAAAFEVRQETNARLPMVAALIAGAARARGFELVHRDQHLAAIPATCLRQRLLPAIG